MSNKSTENKWLVQSVHVNENGTCTMYARDLFVQSLQTAAGSGVSFSQFTKTKLETSTQKARFCAMADALMR